MEFKIIHQEDIDRQKWDTCVHYANQPFFSGYTWYLNAISRDWIGIVEGDYETVVPLFYQRDWLGRRTYYQPSAIAPSGPFSLHMMSSNRINNILEHLPKRTNNLLFAWEGQVNHPTAHIIEATRLLLPLYDVSSPEIFRVRSNDTIPSLQYIQIKPEVLMDFRDSVDGLPERRTSSRHQLLRVMYQAMHRGILQLTGIGRDESTLCAAAAFISQHGYVVRLVSARTKDDLGAAGMQRLYSDCIEGLAGKRVVLDFNHDPFGAAFNATQLQYSVISK